MTISRSIFREMRNVSDKRCREDHNTHFKLNNFLLQNRAVYDVVRKNTVQPDRPQMTI